MAFLLCSLPEAVSIFSSVPSSNAATEMFMEISDSRDWASVPLVLMVKILRLNGVKRQ